MSNRAFTLPGIWALNGLTTIPTPPIPGVSYRNAALGPSDVEGGWPFAQIVDSADFNEYMMVASQLLQQLELQGALSWCAAITYGIGALAFGSDGVLYQSLQAANTNKDPTSTTGWWTPALGVADLSITTAKLADGAVTRAKATALLGPWDNTKSVNVVYQAATDGFVIARNGQAGETNPHSAHQLTNALVGLSDSSNPPATIRAWVTPHNSGPDCETIMFPVKKGDFWKVTNTGNSIMVFWIPLGS